MLSDHFFRPFKHWYFNRFLIAAMCFIVWMTFFDKNNWRVQAKLSDMVDDLETEIDQYEGKVLEAKQDKIDLENNLEKYAREKYYMHKEDEEVFIIDTKNKKNYKNERISK